MKNKLKYATSHKPFFNLFYFEIQEKVDAEIINTNEISHSLVLE